MQNKAKCPGPWRVGAGSGGVDQAIGDSWQRYNLTIRPASSSWWTDIIPLATPGARPAWLCCVVWVNKFLSIDYCNSLLYGISNTSINKLQLVQNAAARLLNHTKSWHHITPVLKDLHWLPVSHRISYKILTLTYKALHQLAPPYLSELLSPYQPQRSLRSTSAGLLSTPKSKLRSFGDRAFSRAAPKLWNSLPKLIRDSDSLTTFQSRLKTHLFSSAYP
ncbi:uncharacterized protein LOC119501650 [Sebastes umbrosus]|uniref:uncharacterized protein LOC119501650 n=1 Tax=Sebastes umbrosus TaxID=72105 RepID=UPI00189DBB72|nr:uncharacterized protein LOC119501650 [Sebastes umbrosus]